MNEQVHDSLKKDMFAGFSVALVAIPLSIGIALASGAPASAGLIAAIIGGVLGARLGGTQLTINGPAAGMIVIVLEASNNLGFKGMLAASLIAGAMQVVFGLIKLGRKSSIFPVSVIHGMMAAIGLIIIAKQVHLMLGHVAHSKNPVMLFSEIPEALLFHDAKVFTIGLSSLFFLIIWSRLPSKKLKMIPAPLLAVVLGAAIAPFIGLENINFLNINADFKSWIIFPDFSAMSSYLGWKSAITMALVGSLETTLSAAAIDKLDPLHRHSDLDRDLISKGICNMFSGAIGGLPMIAEIVRSSANVSYGALTWKSNFTHGLVMLFAVLLLPNALTMIPLATLAAILVMVGSRLGSPTHFMHALKIGKDNAVGFVVTMVVTFSVDLLIGIFAGALAQYIAEIVMGLKLKNTFKPIFKEIDNKTGEELFIINSALTFSNFLIVKSDILMWMEKGKNVKMDLTTCEYIDHSVMEQLDELQQLFTENSLEFKIILSQNHHQVGNDHLSSWKKSS
jgi:MFS superfamily sulfate permease-like transporter